MAVVSADGAAEKHGWHRLGVERKRTLPLGCAISVGSCKQMRKEIREQIWEHAGTNRVGEQIWE
eukprot:2849748-Prymnesium_polylepis.1